MNKMIKLPLFLGIVGGLCGGLLALTNYFTAPKIEENTKKRENAALIDHFNDAEKFSERIELVDLSAKGITEKVYCFDSSNNYIGTVYFCSVVGYAGKNNPIQFTVSYRDGNINKFVLTSSGESSAGATFIDWISAKSDLKNVTYDTAHTETGSSVSAKAVFDAFNLCQSDYAVQQADNPVYGG